MIRLDTSYLVDLLRETARRNPGPATRRLDEMLDEELCLSVHAACELYAGAERSDRPSVEKERVTRLCSGMHLAVPGAGFAETFGHLYASLARRGAVTPRDARAAAERSFGREGRKPRPQDDALVVGCRPLAHVQ